MAASVSARKGAVEGRTARSGGGRMSRSPGNPRSKPPSNGRPKKATPIAGFEQHFSAGRVAATLGVSAKTVTREQDAGTLRYLMIRGRRVVSESALREYIESRKCERKSRSAA
jgi:hypothetical protein